MASVLLIDDNVELLAALSDMLATEGHDVSAACSARFVVDPQSVKSLPDTVDVAVIDLLMPDVDGIEAIRALRMLRPEARIVAISGGGRWGGSRDYLHMAEQFGAIETLQKPFNSAELCKAIDRALEVTASIAARRSRAATR